MLTPITTANIPKCIKKANHPTVVCFYFLTDQETNYVFFLKTVNPSIAVTTTRARKIKNITLAMDAAPAAIPVKPNIAAIIAIMKKIAVHFSITSCFKLIIRELIATKLVL